MGGFVPARFIHLIRRCHDLHLVPPHPSNPSTCRALPLRLHLQQGLTPTSGGVLRPPPHHHKDPAREWERGVKTPS
jgi:hypothetical protein